MPSLSRAERAAARAGIAGHFGKHRTRVVGRKLAPLQVNYVGFPGTPGAGYMDCIVADRQVLPPQHREFYSEKVVYLPDCYQANDGKKEIGARVFSRAECWLPVHGFVFCCFNNNYKVAASSLTAIGLPELIVPTGQAYQERAIKLAGNAEMLAALNRLTAPLFDTERFTAHIEAAYTAMYQRYRAGLPPDHIAVPAQN